MTSSSARTNPQHNTTLGAMEATDYRSIYGQSATFDGEALDDSMVLVKYTSYGDTDFNGRVNFDDYVRTDNGFNNHLTGWLNGDFAGMASSTLTTTFSSTWPSTRSRGRCGGRVAPAQISC